MNRNRVEQDMINALYVSSEEEEDELQFSMELDDEEPEKSSPAELFLKLGKRTQRRFWKYMKLYSSNKCRCIDGKIFISAKRCPECRGWGSTDNLIRSFPYLNKINI